MDESPEDMKTCFEYNPRRGICIECNSGNPSKCVWMAGARRHIEIETAKDGMTAKRAVFFLQRLKAEEKLLDSNVMAAIDYAITHISQPV